MKMGELFADFYMLNMVVGDIFFHAEIYTKLSGDPVTTSQKTILTLCIFGRDPGLLQDLRVKRCKCIIKLLSSDV